MTDLDYFIDVTNSIESGRLDKRLMEVYKVLQARINLIGSVMSVSDFSVGDAVILNDRCGLAGLRGESATVVGIEGDKVIVDFDEAKGEFRVELSDGEFLSKKARVSPELLSRIE